MRPLHRLRIWVSTFWVLSLRDLGREAGWGEVLLTVILFALFWWVVIVGSVWMHLENRSVAK